MFIPLTIDEFNKLTGLKIKLTKKKTIKSREIIYRDDNQGEPFFDGIPVVEKVIPAVKKEVFNTNALNDAICEYWKYFVSGKRAKRISSEGKWRKGTGFIPSQNRGFADVHGIYNGIGFYIETKQKKEAQLDTQKKFQQWVEEQGGIYILAKSFEDFQIKLSKYVKNLPQGERKHVEQ